MYSNDKQKQCRDDKRGTGGILPSNSGVPSVIAQCRGSAARWSQCHGRISRSFRTSFGGDLNDHVYNVYMAATCTCGVRQERSITG